VAKQTAEQACINYAVAQETVKRLSNEISRHSECAKLDGEEDCIDRLFSAPRGPDGEFPRHTEFFDAMCPRCKARIVMIDTRKQERIKFGAAKRAVLAVGKRLNAEEVARG
jgi:hypothetical protein